MTPDQIIAELVDALHRIRREAEEPATTARWSFVMGVADQAIANCNAHRERNRDGYLVVRK